MFPQVDISNEANEVKFYAIDFPKVTTTTDRLYGKKKKRGKTEPDRPRR